MHRTLFSVLGPTELFAMVTATGKEERGPNIEKLEGDSNWPRWRRCMKIYFTTNDLWELITGEEEAPPQPQRHLR